MDFSLMTEPQMGGTYDQLLALARWAEDRGLVSFARSDHYYSSADPACDATDAFATLAGLARETTTIRLGTLVTSVTFRHPGMLAVTVAQVDRMSGGRVEFGIGAGWYEEEHRAYGVPFPSLGERFDLLEDQLAFEIGVLGRRLLRTGAARANGG